MAPILNNNLIKNPILQKSPPRIFPHVISYSQSLHHSTLLFPRSFESDNKEIDIFQEMASTACFLNNLAALSSPAARASSQRSSAAKFGQVVCRSAQKQSAAQEDGGSAAEEATAVSRRLALTVLIGAAAVGSKVSPADAAYGESANIFGKPKTNTEFTPYNGDGFKLSIPSKWNPSKEVEFPGQILRYEDNFDSTTNVSVMVTPSDKKSITDYGPPESFLASVNYLLGKQVYFGQTDSEGGFDSGAVAAANLLEASTPVIGGKQFYFLSILTRTADGDEGGKHQLISATVSNGKLYICKSQAGDKRWFKGARKYVENATNSFCLA